MVMKAIYSGLKHLVKSRMTVKYPDQKLKMAERFKGRHILDIPTCIHCRACFRICPPKAITMVFLRKNEQEIITPQKRVEETPKSTQTDETPEKKNKKREEVFPQISYERCVFCGFCVDVCPTNCLNMSHEYELSVYRKDDLVYTPEQLSEIPSEDEGRFTIAFTKRGVTHAD